MGPQSRLTCINQALKKTHTKWLLTPLFEQNRDFWLRPVPIKLHPHPGAAWRADKRPRRAHSSSSDTVFCFPPAWKRPDSVWPTFRDSLVSSGFQTATPALQTHGGKIAAAERGQGLRKVGHGHASWSSSSSPQHVLREPPRLHAAFPGSRHTAGGNPEGSIKKYSYKTMRAVI